MSDTEISKMNFKQLRNEVQELRDELARFKRAYNDTIENLDDSNLSEYLIKEKEGMKTEIEVSADGIKALVVKSDELGERCTTIEATADKIQTQVTKNQENIGKFDSKLTQTAKKITAEVTAVKEDVGTFKTAINQRADSIESSVSAIETDVGEFNSKIEQTKDSITMTVNAAYSNPVETENFNNVSPKIESVIYYDTTTNLYWHYDGEKWVSGSNANFGTVFEQTADGFKMRGNVKVSGDLVSGGMIKGAKFVTNPNGYGDGFEITNNNGGRIAYIYGGTEVGSWTTTMGGTSIGSINDGSFSINFQKFTVSEVGHNDAVYDLKIAAKSANNSTKKGGKFIVDLTNSHTDYKEVKFIGLNETADGVPRVYANEKLLATVDYVDSHGGGSGGIAVFG